MNSEKLLDEMAETFLYWPLPESVCSDGCTSTPGQKGRIGTQLLTHSEVKEMLRVVVMPKLLVMQKEFADAVVEWTKCQEELRGCRESIAHLEEHKTRLLAQLKAPPLPSIGDGKDGEKRLLNVARGCHDYNGGHRDAMAEAFHHGIDTVIRALEAAAKRDPNDTQVNALERIGSAQSPQAGREEKN